MRKVAVVTGLFLVSLAAQAQGLRIVNAASLSNVSLAPGSIFTIFGTNLATGVAATDNVKTPPTSLGGVSVSIGGSPAALFYVSPTQINGVVNPSTPVGNETVTITSSGATQTTTVTISANAPPGLFSLFGSGSRDGAILNAVTFLLGAFGVTTANTSTYLAIYATGLNLTTAPTVTIGGLAAQVTFYGAAPCCAGLQQINVMLPASLAGAGRVPLVVSSGGNTSNTVQVVVLPAQGQGEFSDEPDHGDRSRELSSLAYVAGTSLVLVADENDDVVRVVDVKAKQVTHIIALPEGSGPEAVAVSSTGTQAVVAETGSGKIAILNLTNFTVTSEVTVGSGPRSVAISGNFAIVVNGDTDNLSIVNLQTGAVVKTLAVGRGPVAVGVDTTTGKAYVTNEDDGTVSVIDLNAQTVGTALTLGASIRPEAIAVVPGSSLALITVPTAGPNGQIVVLNLTTGTMTTVNANPDNSGGSSDVAFYHSNLYVANQTGGSISIIPLTGSTLGTATTVKVGLGARALAIDTVDNVLVVSNEASGTLALVDLATNKVTARVNAVQTGMDGDDNGNDHSDRNSAANAPVIQSVSPNSGKAGATITLTINGSNLTGANDVKFVQVMGQGNGSGNGNKGANDFSVSGIQVNAAGTQLTATVKISSSADSGTRLVKVSSSNGTSSTMMGTANTFMVQ